MVNVEIRPVVDAPAGQRSSQSLHSVTTWLPAVQWVPMLIDAHLDLAYLAVKGRDLTQPLPAEDHARGCITLPALRDASVDGVFATIFTEPVKPEGHDPQTHPDRYIAGDVETAKAAGRRQLEIYQQLEESNELTIVRSASDLSRDDAANPRIVMLMEGADPIASPDDLHWWHDCGLRMVGLTWAMGSRYAGGNAAHGPLTDAGIELVRAIDALNIIHDASHLADEAFDDLFEHASGPIIATHSNCRALMSDNQRHLRDDQIEAITKRGGIIGLNLFTKFLTIDRRATIDDCVKHIEHVCEIAGDRRHVGLGSDMDGGFGPADLPLELDHPSHLSKLTAALKRAGWSDDEVGGFAHGNWLRFLQEHLE